MISRKAITALGGENDPTLVRATPEFLAELYRLLPTLKYRVYEHAPNQWTDEQNPYNPDSKDSLVHELLRQHFDIAPDEWSKILEENPEIEDAILAESLSRMPPPGPMIEKPKPEMEELPPPPKERRS